MGPFCIIQKKRKQSHKNTFIFFTNKASILKNPRHKINSVISVSNNVTFKACVEHPFLWRHSLESVFSVRIWVAVKSGSEIHWLYCQATVKRFLKDTKTNDLGQYQGWATIFVRGTHCIIVCVPRETFESKNATFMVIKWPSWAACCPLLVCIINKESLTQLRFCTHQNQLHRYEKNSGKLKGSMGSILGWWVEKIFERYRVRLNESHLFKTTSIVWISVS
jgi:hypothetical protein